MATEKNLTTTSRIDHPINIFYVNQFLKRAMPLMPHAQFGKKYAMPAHAGDTIKMRRYANPTAQTTPLVEGESPNPVMMSKTDLSATVKEYGAWMKASSWLDLTGMNSDAAERTDWLADQHARTMDTLCREVICGTASSTTCSNGSGTATLPNKTDIDTITKTLMGENAKMLTSRINASSGQGTSPIRPAFIGLAHTNLINDLQKVAGFKEVTNYASNGGIYDGEIGSTGYVRWILTTDGYVSGSSYYCPIIAQDSYANIDIPEGKDLLKHAPANIADPTLGRWSNYGWLANYVARILNDNWIHVMICTAS